MPVVLRDRGCPAVREREGVLTTPLLPIHQRDHPAPLQVFPEHKYLIVEALRQSGFATGMTGDGVNDAPALKRADVGVAVQGSTDAARAAADIVLTQPGLSTVIEAIIIARCIFQRMKNFINYRISATLQLLVFFFIAVITLHPNTYATEETVEAEVRHGGTSLPVVHNADGTTWTWT